MSARFSLHEPPCQSPKIEYSFLPCAAVVSVQSDNMPPKAMEHISAPMPFLKLHVFIFPSPLPGVTSAFTDEVDNDVSVSSRMGLACG